MLKRCDWQPFSLLMIDAQRDFWPEGLAADFDGFPNSVARLLVLCRREGIEVIHLRARFSPDMSDWMPAYKLRGHIPCVQGTEGAEVLPFAVEEPGETIISKHSFDGFCNPELLCYLQREGRQFLLVAGLVTSVCVLLTAASAAQMGFLVAVVEDCCADDPWAHEWTLEKYPFVFERTTVDAIIDQHPTWVAALARLDALACEPPRC
jgi:nicotinamidase-related amidase